MKKGSFQIVLLIVIVLSGCRVYQICFGGNIKEVEICIDASDKFSESEIETAMNIVKKRFQKQYKGCTLKCLEYDSDRKTEFWENMYSTNEVIVISSKFETGSKGVDGSFDPNQVYSDWEWILIKSNLSKQWKLVNYGY